MNSGKIVADGTGGRDGTSKVLQEVLADLKSGIRPFSCNENNNLISKVFAFSVKVVFSFIGRAIIGLHSNYKIWSLHG